MRPAVLMIGGGVQQVDAARVVREAGLRIFVTDRDEYAPTFRHADEAWVVDGADTDEIVRRANEAKSRGLAGVFTLTELTESVAAVAQACGFPGAAPDAARACQDKGLAKRLWVSQGIDTARAGIVEDTGKARVLFEELGGAVFVKPCRGAGSRGAGAARTIDELDRAVTRALEVDDQVLIEELLVGTHHDVNAIFDEHGDFRSAGLADRRFAEKAPVELEASAPTSLTPRQEREALELTREAALALGLRFGPVKSDLVLTERGFRILELAPRLHGPKGTLHLLPLAFGFHPLVAALRVQLGLPLEDSHLTPRHRRAATILAIPPLPGKRLESLGGLREANEVPGIQGIRILMSFGSRMEAMRSNADVVGHVFATGDDLSQARRAARTALGHLELKTDADGEA